MKNHKIKSGISVFIIAVSVYVCCTIVSEYWAIIKNKTNEYTNICATMKGISENLDIALSESGKIRGEALIGAKVYFNIFVQEDIANAEVYGCSLGEAKIIINKINDVQQRFNSIYEEYNENAVLNEHDKQYLMKLEKAFNNIVNDMENNSGRVKLVVFKKNFFYERMEVFFADIDF